ncbi:MAG: sasA [Verrucomicrobiaceae bacterium]|nr:sasA [Verrucomicrobiaceae bacterium]
MSASDLRKLAELIKQQRGALLSDWRRQVRELPSAKNLDTPTLNDHIPLLLDELADAFRRISEEGIAEALLEGSPPAHGIQRLQNGFDIEEVVAEYNILRGCVHDLADTHALNLQGRPFHIMNRVFDGAIALAVQTYTTERALEIQRRREDYLAFVAHDLRTPLNAIALVARMLDVTLHDRGETAETTLMMKTLHRNVRHLETLVSSVLKENMHLETESGVKIERRNLDLWPLVELLIHDLHPVAGTASTQLINQIPDELVIFADATLLRRIFQNLIANAITYTPRGEVIIGARSTDAGVECWITDNGSGVSAARLDVIFDKLETDSKNDGALGLGLTIVKTFVEAHGGSVWAKSQQGAGSTFTFLIPNRPN